MLKSRPQTLGEGVFSTPYSTKCLKFWFPKNADILLKHPVVLIMTVYIVNDECWQNYRGMQYRVCNRVSRGMPPTWGLQVMMVMQWD